MASQYTPAIQPIDDAVLTTRRDTHSDLRRAVEGRAAELGGRSAEGTSRPVPSELTRYVDKVAVHAYKVTDGDIEALHRAGYSEDAIFEITLSAALGAGVARLERGLAALRESNDAPEKR